MHELSLVQDLVRVGLAAAEGRTIRRLVLEVGELTCVAPDALRFAFAAIQAETPLLSEATLEIELQPGRGRCRACAAEAALSSPLDLCSCGGALEWIAGKELQLKLLEVAHV